MNGILLSNHAQSPTNVGDVSSIAVSCMDNYVFREVQKPSHYVASFTEWLHFAVTASKNRAIIAHHGACSTVNLPNIHGVEAVMTSIIGPSSKVLTKTTAAKMSRMLSYFFLVLGQVLRNVVLWEIFTYITGKSKYRMNRKCH